MTEAEHIQRAQAGCRESVAALVAMHIGVIHRIAGSVCHDLSMMDDYVQEATLGFIKAIPKYDPSLGHKLTTYAGGGAKFRCLGLRHRCLKSKTVAMPRGLTDAWHPTIEAKPIDIEPVKVWKAVDAAGLTKQEREAVQLRFVEGKTYEKMSKAMKASAQHTHNQVTHAIAKIRSHMRAVAVAALAMCLATGCAASSAKTNQDGPGDKQSANQTGAGNISYASAGIGLGTACVLTGFVCWLYQRDKLNALMEMNREQVAATAEMFQQKVTAETVQFVAGKR